MPSGPGPERDEAARALFLAVIEKDPDTRKAILDAVSTTAEVRARVEGLLAQHEEMTTFLEPTPPRVKGDSSSGLVPKAGDRIGPYLVRRVLGEGTFGVVCEAEQLEPVHRTVALKILKGGMDTARVIARFQVERQTLAMMDHRFIAKVYDAGATEGGRPYFVMEYVDGVPITRFCDERRLATRERLHLFVQVCEAIQHAHQKGVTHRDVKPSNVLVTLQGECAVPKVIDFGIAKATALRAGGSATLTEQGQLVGTPAYMSPEQAGFGAIDVDTRSDIYSLGALLYELLVGAPPFDPERLRAVDLAEIQRILREEEPPSPSARVAVLQAAGASPWRARHASARALQRELRGDLDWIILKALEKDRVRRYGSASELAADVVHHLAHEPVKAGPPSQWYRLAKLVRRNRAGVAAAVLVLLVLAAGIAGIAWQRARAERQATVAGGVIQVLGDVFSPASSGVSIRDRVDPALLADLTRQLEAEEVFADRPKIRGRVFGWLGYVHHALGDFAGAEHHWREALRVRTETLGDQDPETLQAMTNLATALLDEHKLDLAEQLCRRASSLTRATLGEDDPLTLTATSQLAAALQEAGRMDEAEPLLRDVLGRQRRVRGDRHRETLDTMRRLARVLAGTARLEAAAPLLEEVVQSLQRSRGPSDARTLAALAEFAVVQSRLGQLEEAEATLRRVREAQVSSLGGGHPDLLATTRELAAVLRQRGKADDAEALLRATLTEPASVPRQR